MTPESVSEVLPLEIGLFDLLIFDEASQIYIEKGIPAIYRTKKVVIAGDHKQLRPSSLGVGRIEQEKEIFIGKNISKLEVGKFIEFGAQIGGMIPKKKLIILKKFITR